MWMPAESFETAPHFSRYVTRNFDAPPSLAGEMPPLQLAITADDFGLSHPINQAIMRAHRDGAVTHASLMITGDAAEEAVALARQAPNLAVGLHAVVVRGRPALSPEQIPHIVDAAGQFGDDPVRTGVHYFFSRRAQRDLANELRAQFERFMATGLPLSHVDTHMHMHMHPTVLDLMLPLMRRYGVRRCRVPRDSFPLAARHDRSRLLTKAAWAGVFGVLSRWAAWRMRRNGLNASGRTYGLMQSGHMDELYVLELLKQIEDASAEIYFHPTLGQRVDALGANPRDLETLLNARVKQAIQERRLPQVPASNQPAVDLNAT